MNAVVSDTANAASRSLQGGGVERLQGRRLAVRRLRVRGAVRNEAAPLEEPAGAPCPGVSRDESAKRRLGREMLPLDVDVELACARIRQVRDGLGGRGDAADRDRPDLVRIL